MSFLNLNQLIEAVNQHAEFQHEIKGKRVRKELSGLLQYHNDTVTFKKFEISSMGISFYLETQYQFRLYDFQILIDFQYPFNRPKVFYLHENSSYSYAQDLLDTILETSWGPSMLLATIFDKINLIASKISEYSDTLKPVYQINDIYSEQLLRKYKVELFKVDQYEWKYMIKSTSKKVLGLTKQTLLKFVPLVGNKLRLDLVIKIKDLKYANANINGGKFKLEISVLSEIHKDKLYFGGDDQYIENILYFMNPMHVIERKMARSEKDNYSNIDPQEAIKNYSELIEFYSLKDKEKTQKYVTAIQVVIKKKFEGTHEELKVEGKKMMMEQREDIKT